MMRRKTLTIDTRLPERPLFHKQQPWPRRRAIWISVLVALAVASGLMAAGDLGIFPL